MSENKIDKNFQKLGYKTNEIGNKFNKYRESAFSRFPLLFVLLSSFGLVATFYGFEKVIDQIDFFSKYPSMVLVTGIIVLIITGSLYKKLK
jgi:hypothetical protein